MRVRLPVSGERQPIWLQSRREALWCPTELSLSQMGALRYLPHDGDAPGSQHTEADVRPFIRARGFTAHLRAVIGENPPKSRERIATTLTQHTDITLVATCLDWSHVIDAVRSFRPDVVLLDVELPDISRFEVIRALTAAAMPPVVLVAPTPHLAARAFDIGAIDFLVKPLQRNRVERALNRVRAHLAREYSFDLTTRVLRQILHAQGSDVPIKRIMVRSATGRIFIDSADIDRIEADGNYVRLHVGKKSYRLRQALSRLEARLGSHNFARVHRSQIVRVQNVRELRIKPDGRYEVVLNSGVIVPVSRLYRSSLAERLAQGGLD